MIEFDIGVLYDFKNRTRLCKLMDDFGSDKGSFKDIVQHNYTSIYDALFRRHRYKHMNIFELGIGTTNCEIPSHMDPHSGHPGASLKAWKAYFPNSQIYGADIDHQIIFSEDRIYTNWVDQTSVDAIEKLWERFNLKFNIMIDDGLHQFQANKTFFESSIQQLDFGGLYIIEDISKIDIPKFEEQIQLWKSQYPDLLFRLEPIEHQLNVHDNCLLLIHRPIRRNIYLATFGSIGYESAVQRLVNQGKQTGLFAQIFAMTEEQLSNESDFWYKHKYFILSNLRGFGYWIWKPYIILKLMSQLQDGDILLYLDSGCEIKSSLSDLLHQTLIHGSCMGFVGTPSLGTHREYTKFKVLLNYGLDLNDCRLDSYQMNAGALIMVKNQRTMNLITDWYQNCCQYHLVDDSSDGREQVEFTDHRHDQSILNCLLLSKYMDFMNMDIMTNEVCNNIYPWSKYNYPILYVRNKNATSYEQIYP